MQTSPATLTHEEAFLQAIAEEPEDNSLRLMFADWLEERDDPRGEFIRVQVEMAEVGRATPQWRTLWSRQAQLLQTHERRWLREVRRHLKGWYFRRGLLQWVSMGVNQFLEHGEMLFRKYPIQELKLIGGRQRLGTVARCPHLARLTMLDLQNNRLDDAAMEKLAASPHLYNLTRLELSWNQIGDQGARALAASRSLENLTRLDLFNNNIGEKGRKALRNHFGDVVHW